MILPTWSLILRNRRKREREKKMSPTLVRLLPEVQAGGEELSKGEGEGAGYLKCGSNSSLALVILDLAQPTFRLLPPHPTLPPLSAEDSHASDCTARGVWAHSGTSGCLPQSSPQRDPAFHPFSSSGAPVLPSGRGVPLVGCPVDCMNIPLLLLHFMIWCGPWLRIKIRIGTWN